MHLPKGVLQCMCACNTCVLQCRCAHTACRACVSTGLLLLCCQHVGCACVQDVAAQESLRPCACAWRCARCLVKRGWPGAYVRCNRDRSLGTNADCRTNSAQVDRQVWASGGRGRGRFTVRRGWTWASRRARAWEMGRAMRREDMLGKCCLGVRNVSWLLAGLGKEVASAEHAGPEGSGGGLCVGV